MKRIFLASVIMLSCVAGFSQAAPQSAGKAKIQFDKPTFSFGSIPQNVPATHTFTFTNTGTEPLIITSASPSCGCTTPDWTKAPVAPGKKGFIKATFNAAGLGAFSKTISVASNAENGNTVLTFVGDVKAANTPAQASTAAKPITATAPKKN